MTTKTTRVDELGRAYAGSQLQIQLYVNRWSEELSQKVIQGLPALASLHPRFNWVSPLEKDRFAEYQDIAFLKACGLKYLSDDLISFAYVIIDFHRYIGLCLPLEELSSHYESHLRPCF